jgi:hypothetical protein
MTNSIKIVNGKTVGKEQNAEDMIKKAKDMQTLQKNIGSVLTVVVFVTFAGCSSIMSKNASKARSEYAAQERIDAQNELINEVEKARVQHIKCVRFGRCN